ncbi:MAG: HAD-IA family hydrolase [Gemmatimonadaceae bacterium]|jgi:sugar-phosphatase|nr:HAD-IA family hydrolase [Gemmatimonadaceae bacterium]
MPITTRSSLTCTALLFDLDGTLVDSAAAVERQWRAWGERHGLDGDALMRVVHGRRAIDTIRLLAPHADAEAEVAALSRAEADDTEGVVALPGARDMLAGIDVDAWAIVTSGTPDVARARIAAAGLPCPRVLVTAHDVQRGKPDPEGFRLAARHLGVATEACIVVEDAPAGVAAARAAAMRCIALTTTHDAYALHDADWQLPSLAAVELRRSAAASEGITLVART